MSVNMTKSQNRSVVGIGSLVKYRGFQPIFYESHQINKNCGIVVMDVMSKRWGARVLEYEVLWCCGIRTREHYSMLELIQEKR